MLRLLVIGFALSLAGCSADSSPAKSGAPAGATAPAGKGKKAVGPPVE